MSVFETVRAAVDMKQVAEMYGQRVGRNGMICCPFHVVVANSISFAPPQAAGLIHFAAPPLPTKPSGFAGALLGTPA